MMRKDEEERRNEGERKGKMKNRKKNVPEKSVWTVPILSQAPGSIALGKKTK
jgi:hypothetical protein